MYKIASYQSKKKKVNIKGIILPSRPDNGIPRIKITFRAR
jgi:hypothetical protein